MALTTPTPTSTTLLADWFEEKQPRLAGLQPNITVYAEAPTQRAAALPGFRRCVLDHHVGLEFLSSMGYPKSRAVVENRLPTPKRVRSGDLGEILATEYIIQDTTFEVPIKRLRHKDDRDLAMRGNDVLAFKWATPPAVLKAEAKSRAKLTPSVVKEACDGLSRHKGMPNPATLAFLSMRLREQGKDNLAASIERLQQASLNPSQVEHLVFTFSGNDPSKQLNTHAASAVHTIKHSMVGFVIADHQKFIAEVYDSL